MNKETLINLPLLLLLIISISACEKRQPTDSLAATDKVAVKNNESSDNSPIGEIPTSTDGIGTIKIGKPLTTDVDKDTYGVDFNGYRGINFKVIKQSYSIGSPVETITISCHNNPMLIIGGVQCQSTYDTFKAKHNSAARLCLKNWYKYGDIKPEDLAINEYYPVGNTLYDFEKKLSPQEGDSKLSKVSIPTSSEDYSSDACELIDKIIATTTREDAIKEALKLKNELEITEAMKSLERKKGITSSSLIKALTPYASTRQDFIAFRDEGGLDKNSDWFNYDAQNVSTNYANDGRLRGFVLDVTKAFRSDKLPSMNNLKRDLSAYCGYSWESVQVSGEEGYSSKTKIITCRIYPNRSGGARIEVSGTW